MSEKTESVQCYVDTDTKRELRIAAAENDETMASFVRSAIDTALEQHKADQ